MPDGYQATAGENLECRGTQVDVRFFETFGMHLISGRDFGPRDEMLIASTNTTALRSAVINEAMARRYFGEANPLGRTFHSVDQPEKKFEIVGVIADAKYRSLREAATPAFYLPFFQEDRGSGVTFALRTTVDPRPMEALRYE